MLYNFKVFTETNSKSYNEDNVKYQNSAERTNIKATKHIEHVMFFDWKDALAIQRKQIKKNKISKMQKSILTN